MSEEYQQDWGTLLALVVTVENGGSLAIPFTNFRYRVSTDAEEIHLPSQWSAGWHDMPPAFTASFDVNLIGKTGPFIHQAQLRRAIVEFVMTPESGEDWGFVKLAMAKGKIVDVDGSNFGAREIPQMSVSMKFNDFTYEGV